MSWKNVQYENGKYRTSEGGGGGSSTFADLDDVSFSDLQNGQIPKYNSTTQKWENANESGSEWHEYSTDEKVVGKWIDGKPLYERTAIFTNSSGISGEVNLMAIDSTWRLIDAKVHVYNSSNQRTYFFPYMTSAYDSIMVSNGYLKLVSNDSWGSAYSPFYITIQYTKTTDV